MADDTAIRKWADDLQEVLNRMPEGYWLCAAVGQLHVMQYGDDEDRVIGGSGKIGGYMSEEAVVTSLDVPDYSDVDGGDW